MKFSLGRKRWRSVVSFGSILPEIINEFDLEKSFTIENLKAIWYNLVGDIISTHSMPERISRGVLYIAADHSVFANEIIMMKDSILCNINENFYHDAVKNIRVVVKKNWSA